MLKTLLFLAASQLSGLVQWTDDEGVVHVASAKDAPAGARPLEGGGYSVIDADGRPRVMPDGGTRTADAADWRARFKAARTSLASSQEAERTAELATRPSLTCVKAKARAKAQVLVVSNRPGLVGAITSQGQRVLVAPAGQPVLVTDRAEQTVERCEEQRAPAFAFEQLAQRRGAREQAERELSGLEQQARAAGVPVREWY